MSGLTKLVVAFALCAAGLLLTIWVASSWWEKAFATRLLSQTTADGCYRLEMYKPYWLLPVSFHPDRDPRKRWNPFTDWNSPLAVPDLPRFYRIYDQRAGRLLVETEVYDRQFYDIGDALFANPVYESAGGSIVVGNADDMDLHCGALEP